eukprot:gb/GECG01008413.1/.p1 GENE.gb/GECG01008413.1/~~gb/GECG01008413.1/.p1  ORF type:complete len:159 (+),score=7.45 gb/GECG01008413.1/:1-477(+)
MLIRGVRKSSFRLIKSRGGNKNLELQLQQTPPLWFIQATDSTLRSCSRRWTSTTPSSKRTTATAATATVEEEKLVPEEKETHAEKPQKLSLKQIVQLYGKSAIGIYAALYFAPLIGGYYLFRAVCVPLNYHLSNLVYLTGYDLAGTVCTRRITLVWIP